MMPPHASGSRGRSQTHRQHQQHRRDEPPPKAPYPPPSAFVQAYEANLIWDEPTRAAEQLTRSDDLPESSRVAGRGLIRWQGEGEEVWVDRYDTLHLLPSIPTAGPSHSGRRRSSSSSSSAGSSWADRPSDQEETFDLSSDEEYEAYERDKRIKQIARLREARLEDREKEDEVLKVAEEKKQSRGWGGDDEVPPDAILTLMSHTALSLSASPNPSVLEMRILTNHSTDDRFSFLRGRYRHTWTKVKDQVRREKRQDPQMKQKEEKNVGMLVGGYESNSEPEEPDSPPPPPPPDNEEPPPVPPEAVIDTPVQQGEDRVSSENKGEEDEARRQERRRRVQEWKKSRAP